MSEPPEIHPFQSYIDPPYPSSSPASSVSSVSSSSASASASASVSPPRPTLCHIYRHTHDSDKSAAGLSPNYRLRKGLVGSWPQLYARGSPMGSSTRSPGVLTGEQGRERQTVRILAVLEGVVEMGNSVAGAVGFGMDGLKREDEDEDEDRDDNDDDERIYRVLGEMSDTINWLMAVVSRMKGILLDSESPPTQEMQPAITAILETTGQLLQSTISVLRESSDTEPHDSPVNGLELLECLGMTRGAWTSVIPKLDLVKTQLEWMARKATYLEGIAKLSQLHARTFVSPYHNHRRHRSRVLFKPASPRYMAGVHMQQLLAHYRRKNLKFLEPLVRAWRDRAPQKDIVLARFLKNLPGGDAGRVPGNQDPNLATPSDSGEGGGRNRGRSVRSESGSWREAARGNDRYRQWRRGDDDESSEESESDVEVRKKIKADNTPRKDKKVTINSEKEDNEVAVDGAEEIPRTQTPIERQKADDAIAALRRRSSVANSQRVQLVKTASPSPPLPPTQIIIPDTLGAPEVKPEQPADQTHQQDPSSQHPVKTSGFRKLLNHVLCIIPPACKAKKIPPSPILIPPASNTPDSHPTLTISTTSITPAPSYSLNPPPLSPLAATPDSHVELMILDHDPSGPYSVILDRTQSALVTSAFTKCPGLSLSQAYVQMTSSQQRKVRNFLHDGDAPGVMRTCIGVERGDRIEQEGGGEETFTVFVLVQRTEQKRDCLAVIWLIDAINRCYKIPVAKCQSYEDMEKFIGSAFQGIQTANVVQLIEKRQYDLVTQYGEVVHPQAWEEVVGAGTVVRMKLWPEKSRGLSSPPSSGLLGPENQEKDMDDAKRKEHTGVSAKRREEMKKEQERRLLWPGGAGPVRVGKEMSVAEEMALTVVGWEEEWRWARRGVAEVMRGVGGRLWRSGSELEGEVEVGEEEGDE